MTDPPAFADVEPALMVYLEDLGQGFTSTPPDLKERLLNPEIGKVLRIKRVGGGSTRNTDDPRVSVQAFTLRDPEKPRSSHKLAGAVEARIAAIADNAGVIEIPPEYGGGRVRLDSGEKESGPVEFPWPDADVLVVESIFRISTRR